MPKKTPRDNPESILTEMLRSLFYAAIVVGIAALLVMPVALSLILSYFA